MFLALALGLTAIAQEGLPLAVEPGTLEATLDSGLRVTLVGDPELSLCAVVHHVGVGAAHEESGEEGAAHFVEHLLFAGTERYPDGALWDLLDGLGASANGTTSHDSTEYEATLPPAGLLELLEVEADRFSGVGWGPEAVERERRVILDELRLRDGTEPMDRLVAKLRTDLYLDHPYARPTGGTAAQVAALDLAALEAFHRRWYRAGNLHLVVVGPHDPRALLGEVEALYADLPTGRTEQPLPEVDLQDMPAVVKVHERGVHLGLTGYAWPLPFRTWDAAVERLVPPEDRPRVVEVRARASAATLVAWTRGGVAIEDPESATSLLAGEVVRRRLQRALRDERGETYGVWTKGMVDEVAGAFVLGTSLDPARAEGTIALVEAELERLHTDGVTAAEVERAQALAGSEVIAEVHAPWQAMELEVHRILHRDATQRHHLLHRASKLDHAEVDAFVRSFYRSAEFTRVVVRP